MTDSLEALVVLDRLRKYFPIRKGFLGRHSRDLKALDGVSFTISEGEIYGLVGESGSGKTTLGYSVVGIYKPTSGKVLFRGQDIWKAKGADRWTIKKQVQIVFQDPGSSLNPRKTIAQTLQLPLRMHKVGDSHGLRARMQELLELVEIPSAYLKEHPAVLSGGQKQRVAIARSLASQPSFIVLDEPTSSLDVSVQAKIISLLMGLRSDFGLSYLFITHDLSLMRNMATRIAIMYLGKICEIATASDFFQHPLHPYTQLLLASIPVISDEERALKPEMTLLKGEVPSPVNIPSGCSFHPRCPSKLQICKEEDPASIPVGSEHSVRCHLFRAEDERD